ncbi:MAG: hypothetical protein OXI88_00435 [Gammaproteobacteria bacterium]|nr:hypothetical protein [Gammaproteobacteria bacterium]MDE0510247.1 hypothetical protein [Gammaproteobacteria bacterium]
MNILPTIYFMLVFSLLSLGLSFRVEERARSLVPDRVQNAIIQLALAQHRYISDPGNPASGSYAGDIATLSDYLPIWEPEPGFATPVFAFPATGGFTIRYQAADNAEAGRIAARLGAVAQVSANTVTVGFADPTDLALLDTFISREDAEDEFVRKAGDEMTGALSFTGGIGGAIDLNQNTLTDVLRVIARNPGATGTVEADIIVGTTATFNDILINP